MQKACPRTEHLVRCGQRHGRSQSKAETYSLIGYSPHRVPSVISTGSSHTRYNAYILPGGQRKPRRIEDIDPHGRLGAVVGPARARRVMLLSNDSDVRACLRRRLRQCVVPYSIPVRLLFRLVAPRKRRPQDQPLRLSVPDFHAALCESRMGSTLIAVMIFMSDRPPALAYQQVWRQHQPSERVAKEASGSWMRCGGSPSTGRTSRR